MLNVNYWIVLDSYYYYINELLSLLHILAMFVQCITCKYVPKCIILFISNKPVFVFLIIVLFKINKIVFKYI